MPSAGKPRRESLFGQRQWRRVTENGDTQKQLDVIPARRIAKRLGDAFQRSDTYENLRVADFALHI